MEWHTFITSADDDSKCYFSLKYLIYYEILKKHRIKVRNHMNHFMFQRNHSFASLTRDVSFELSTDIRIISFKN